MPIQRLPPLLVNQIAAGEVIERPASVVKELLENAIDAGAGRIEVAIEQGGCELIRVTDDGCGIAFEELPLALAPHATSKIRVAEDLDAIATMGFRGEALASVASVSRIMLLSRPRDQPGAGIITGEGERFEPPRPAAGPPGTTVTVRNLFFNTPARRKFLRTEQTETGRVRESVQHVALAHPSIAFTFSINEEVRLELPPKQKPSVRVVEVLGAELESELLEVSADERGIQIRGMIGRPSIARTSGRHQHVYLNGRRITDRSISHAVREAYRGLVEPTKWPVVVLFLQMHPSDVDVNVHPTKAEVRFRNQSAVHGAVYHAIRSSLQEADLTPALELTRPGALRSRDLRREERHQFLDVETSVEHPPPDGVQSSSAGWREQGSDERSRSSARAFVDYFRRLDQTQKGFVFSEVKQALASEDPELLEAELARETSSASGGSAGGEALPTLRSVTGALQVHSSYIVTQDADGLVIIDQHALHERVMFEKLKARLESGALQAQRLLMPATFEADRQQVETLEQLQPLLEQIGIEAELIGPSTVAVHAFTALLFERGVTPATFLAELLSKASSESLGSDRESALHEVLDMMACKAAVKAGDRLGPVEIEELLKYRAAVERSSNCPHGRPTSLRLSLRDLEKQFGRR